METTYEEFDKMVDYVAKNCDPSNQVLAANLADLTADGVIDLETGKKLIPMMVMYAASVVCDYCENNNLVITFTERKQEDEQPS